MYEQYLKKRMDSPGNGLITDEAVSNSISDVEMTTVVYEVYDRHGCITITFGKGNKIAVSSVGRASGISNCVSYGWELLDHGADTVIVKVLGMSFLCDEGMAITQRRVREVIQNISVRVTPVPKPNTKQITLWCEQSEFRTMSVWYDQPERHRSRSGYLANLGSYLSKIFDAPVQLDNRAVGVEMEIEHPKYQNRERNFVSVTALGNLGMSEDVLDTVATALRAYDFKTLVEHRAASVGDMSDPAVVFEIHFSDWTYTLPVWARKPDSASVHAVESVLKEAFKTLASTVSVDIK